MEYSNITIAEREKIKMKGLERTTMTNRQKAEMIGYPIVIANHPRFYNGIVLCPHCHKPMATEGLEGDIINNKCYLRAISTCAECGLYNSTYYSAYTGEYMESWVEDYEMNEENEEDEDND